MGILPAAQTQGRSPACLLLLHLSHTGASGLSVDCDHNDGEAAGESSDGAALSIHPTRFPRPLHAVRALRVVWVRPIAPGTRVSGAREDS